MHSGGRQLESIWRRSSFSGGAAGRKPDLMLCRVDHLLKLAARTAHIPAPLLDVRCFRRDTFTTDHTDVADRGPTVRRFPDFSFQLFGPRPKRIQIGHYHGTVRAYEKMTDTSPQPKVPAVLAKSRMGIR